MKHLKQTNNTFHFFFCTNILSLSLFLNINISKFLFIFFQDSMATNENILLYAESKLTRKQAIDEIANIILQSNMKPEMVKYALEILQKLLPSDNTLPNNIDELFSAMMSCKFKYTNE